MKRCVIFGGGDITDQRYARNLISPDDYIICADSGYSYCSSMNIVPNLVLGDFDSYRGDVAKSCEIIRYDSKKDDTDTMLAVKTAIQRGYRDLLMLGMTGGRLDHTLANIQTVVYAIKQGACATMVDRSCIVTAISDGQSVTIPFKHKFTVSVFAHTDMCSGVYIRNAQYTLEDQIIVNSMPLGVSNSFITNLDVEIGVKKGILVIISNREN